MPLALAACGGKDDLDELALNDTPPEVLFNEGLSLRAQGKLRDSAQKFEELDKLYPYSEYSKKSLVNLAFLNYSRGKYTRNRDRGEAVRDRSTRAMRIPPTCCIWPVRPISARCRTLPATRP